MYGSLYIAATGLVAGVTIQSSIQWEGWLFKFPDVLYLITAVHQKLLIPMYNGIGIQDAGNPLHLTITGKPSRRCRIFTQSSL